MSLDGKPVDSAGMIIIDGENVNLNEIVERKYAGDKVAVRFLREGAGNDVEIALKPLQASRMYSIQYENAPRYVVFAGLVFQPLDTNLFATSKFEDVTLRRFYTDYVPKGLFTKHKDIVVLTRVESDPVTSQLSDFTGYVVKEINGVEVSDLAHAHELLHPKEMPEFFVITLFDAERPIVIPSAKVAEANKRMVENGIESLENLKD
jgi:hypothetical protein